MPDRHPGECQIVIPANAGIRLLKDSGKLGSGVRRNDDKMTLFRVLHLGFETA
jgi:hypothetical protein